MGSVQARSVKEPGFGVHFDLGERPLKANDGASPPLGEHANGLDRIAPGSSASDSRMAECTPARSRARNTSDTTDGPKDIPRRLPQSAKMGAPTWTNALASAPTDSIPSC